MTRPATASTWSRIRTPWTTVTLGLPSAAREVPGTERSLCTLRLWLPVAEPVPGRPVVRNPRSLRLHDSAHYRGRQGCRRASARIAAALAAARMLGFDAHDGWPASSPRMAG